MARIRDDLWYDCLHIAYKNMMVFHLYSWEKRRAKPPRKRRYKACAKAFNTMMYQIAMKYYKEEKNEVNLNG